MEDTRFILVTSRDRAQVYTNGHSYSLRRRAGHWKAWATSKHGEEHRERMRKNAELAIGHALTWQACGDPPFTFYDLQSFPDSGCPGCKLRESVIAELFDALSLGWIDLKSNKFKKLQRLVEGVTNGR